MNFRYEYIHHESVNWQSWSARKKKQQQTQYTQENHIFMRRKVFSMLLCRAAFIVMGRKIILWSINTSHISTVFVFFLRLLAQFSPRYTSQFVVCWFSFCWNLRNEPQKSGTAAWALRCEHFSYCCLFFFQLYSTSLYSSVYFNFDSFSFKCRIKTKV